jgi:hypothetical protein
MSSSFDNFQKRRLISLFSVVLSIFSFISKIRIIYQIQKNY